MARPNLLRKFQSGKQNYMTKYNHRKIELKWQRFWEKSKLYATPKNPKRKQYVLDMFPYPSGAGLHVGHPEGYTATDIYSRYLRMNSYDVLHPMGWDAFGLPAENYAIKAGIHPAKSTQANIKRFREQIKMLGLSYDWDREIDTSASEYYKWTQWLFLKLYEKGLAYRKEANVNWCPTDQTVLANEQVVNGKCERCGTDVIQKMTPQWFFKITDYAEVLLAGLDTIDWPEPIKIMQRNWIGRSEGAEIDFPVVIPAQAGIQGSGSPIKSGMTENDVKRFVILHGYTGRANGVFLPWIKLELEKRGYEVEIPQLPNPDTPKESEQVEHILKKCKIDENTVLVGHSLGGVVAMKVLQKYGKPVAGLVLLAAAIDPSFPGVKPRLFHQTFSWDIDYKLLQNLAGFRSVVSDLNEGEPRIGYLENLAKKLDAQLSTGRSEKPHFTGSKEQIILENLLPPPLNLPLGQGEKIRVFTTRPDTIFGATYMVLAPEHNLVETLRQAQGAILNIAEVEEYIAKARKKTELQRTAFEKEKTGVELKGIKAINPATNEEIPVWIADYVLMGYGTGAIMAVPAHDERDFVFAKKYKLPIKKVVEPPEVVSEPVQPPSAGAWGHLDADLEADCWIGHGKIINSGRFDGMDSEKAKWEITKFVKGGKKTQYKLRDWLISRQRYWGAPIPMVYCDGCGMQAVPEKDLPVKLPTDMDFKPTGESPLARSKSFHKVKCPNCGRPARRETDTMDTFVDSSWYYLRYTDPKNKKEPFDKLKAHKWVPVDMYVGGAEHAVLHLLYSRFICRALADMEYLKFKEPFLKLRNQGLILGPDGQKMSKSKGNVINPDEVVEAVGADSMRMYEMFMGPLEDAKPWSMKGIKGVRRFLEKVWRLFFDVIPSAGSGQALSGVKDLDSYADRNRLQNDKSIETLLHKTIKKVTEDIQNFKFNTAVSALMILANEFSIKNQELSMKELKTLLMILAPFAPHITEELWHQLGHKKSIHLEKWPQYDKRLIKDEQVSVVVQVNGKVRATIKTAQDASEDEAKKLAIKDPNVKKYTAGKEIKKIVYVFGKIINFVVG